MTNTIILMVNELTVTKKRMVKCHDQHNYLNGQSTNSNKEEDGQMS